MKYTVLLEEGAESWGASVPDLPGCVAVGSTKEEVLQLITEAIELQISELRRAGQKVPEPVSAASCVEVAA